MQYESSGVFVWTFPRNSAPAGTRRGDGSQINTADWGLPAASFPFYDGCSANHIDLNQQVTMNIDFCGGFVASRPGNCPMVADPASCAAYVANNPGAFADAYFDINSFAYWSQ